MTIDDVIRDFATTGQTFPRASLQWALDHWDEAAPALIEVLERYARGEDRSEEAKSAVFFVVHLLGQQPEPKAFAALCRLMRDAEASDEALGDAETETLPAIVINTYDGNIATLRGVIEDIAADQFVRNGALLAMAYLTRAGRITDAEMREYLLYLHAEMQPQDESFIWVGWVEAVAGLGYDDYTPLVEQLFQRGLVGDYVMGLHDFHEDLRRTQQDPERRAGFFDHNLEPFDVIERLSGWYCFSERYKRDLARWRADSAARERLALADTGRPSVNIGRKLGRNDPCLCGSSKKYKKCCLNNTPALTLSAAQ